MVLVRDGPQQRMKDNPKFVLASFLPSVIFFYLMIWAMSGINANSGTDDYRQLIQRSAIAMIVGGVTSASIIIRGVRNIIREKKAGRKTALYILLTIIASTPLFFILPVFLRF